jgi:large subunit ribosomal protein L16
MLLQPRKFKNKSRHKIRRLPRFTNLSYLTFGQVGLCLLQPLRLSSKSIFRIKLFVNKSSKRSEDTRRKTWLNVFPHLPLTKKPIGSRMGKGIGKLKTWLSISYSGHVLIEFKNLRNGRAFFFLKQVQKRIKCNSKPVFRSSGLTISTSFNKNKVSYQSFW